MQLKVNLEPRDCVDKPCSKFDIFHWKIQNCPLGGNWLLATEGKWTMTKLERRNDDVYDWVIVLTTILRSWLNPSLWHLHFCRNSTVVSRNACIIIFNAAAAVLCLYRREEHFVGIIIITGELIPKKAHVLFYHFPFKDSTWIFHAEKFWFTMQSCS